MSNELISDKEWQKYLNKNPDIKKGILNRVLSEKIYRRLYFENKRLKQKLNKYHIKFTFRWKKEEKDKIIYLRDIKKLSFSKICTIMELSQIRARRLYNCAKRNYENKQNDTKYTKN